MPRTQAAQAASFKGFGAENRIGSALMSQAPTVDTPDTLRAPSANRFPNGSFAVFTAIILVCGTAALAFLTSGAGASVMLPILGILAALGVFLVFGIIAGHIRIAARTLDAELLEDVFARVDHGLVVTGADGQVRMANAAAADLLGVDNAEDLGLLEQAFTTNGEANSAFFRMTRAVNRGLARSEEICLTPSGPLRTGRWLRIAAKPLNRGQIDAEFSGAVIWSIHDISRDKARESQLRASFETRIAAYDTMPAGLFNCDADGRVTLINDQLAAWLGLQTEERDQEVFLTDIIAGDGSELIRRLATETGDERHRIDLDLVNDEGYAWPATLLVNAPQTNRPSSPMTASDWTAVVLPRVEDQATDFSVGETAGPDALGRFFRSAPFGIAAIDPEGRIAGANSAFSRLLMNVSPARGSTAQAILTRGLTDDDRMGVENALKAVLAGKANVAPVEITVGEDHSHTRRLFFGATGRAGGAGSFAVVYVIDATEQKALEKKFAQSQKMEVVGKLAGGIAHDFNNVMTAIIGFSDLLLGTHRPGDPAYHNIKNIKSSAERAADLVRNLLAFSRQQQLQPKTLHLQEVVTDISSMLNRTLGERIELKIQSARDLWLVKADRNELERVIVNLAVNAGDAMPDGGQLTIRTSNVSERESARLKAQGLTPGEYVCLEVEDTGTGMDQATLNKIFEPFFTTKSVGKGTGLGLSSVYGIVKQTGGFVYPDSTLGKGTTFSVYLPRFEPDDIDVAADEPSADDKPKHRDLTGVGRVLIVEDEDAVRMFATQALKRQGYEVTQAADGYDALDLFEDEDFEVDLIVSDVKMPEMDGPTLLKEVRKTHPDMKFVFVSGYPADAFSKTLSDEDNYTFLPKPYSLAQIAAMVKEQIGR